jgi:hypothetical protein
MYLLTEREGQTGKYLAQGHGCMDRAQLALYRMAGRQIFSSLARPSEVENKNKRKRKHSERVRTPFEQAGRLFTVRSPKPGPYGSHHVTFLYGF